MANIASFTDQQEHILTSSILCSCDILQIHATHIQVFSTFSPPSCDKSSPDCSLDYLPAACGLCHLEWALSLLCELAAVQVQTLQMQLPVYLHCVLGLAVLGN